MSDFGVRRECGHRPTLVLRDGNVDSIFPTLVSPDDNVNNICPNLKISEDNVDNICPTLELGHNVDFWCYGTVM